MLDAQHSGSAKVTAGTISRKLHGERHLTLAVSYITPLDRGIKITELAKDPTTK